MKELTKEWILANPEIAFNVLVQEAEEYSVANANVEIDPVKYASRVIKELTIENEIKELTEKYKKMLNATSERMVEIESLALSLKFHHLTQTELDYYSQLDQLRVEACQLAIDILLNR